LTDAGGDRMIQVVAEPLNIVFAEPFDAGAIEKARAHGTVTVLESCDEATLMAAVQEADALLVRTRARVSRAVIEQACRLRVIGRGGVGLENIDLAAAKDQGILVVNTPDAATDAVADLAVWMMISLVRQLSGCDASVREGRFAEARAAAGGEELRNLAIGIVGFGRIGRAVAQRCYRGFETRILYNDIVTPDLGGVPAESRSKDELYSESDIVTLHVPLTEATHRMIDDEALRHFKPRAVLINTARGGVVDGRAVARALGEGRLAGAAFDVLDEEPPAAEHPLLHAPRTLFTPHIGARTRGGLERMNSVIDEVLRVLGCP
jgi:D-3-phosphoglycerate dehydrogenase